MAVQTFNPTDLSQSATNWAVAQRIVGPFAPHAQLTPNLTLALDPGFLLSGTTLTEVNAQNVGPFAPPSSGFRIDRVVIDRSTGAASIVTGAANSLTPPAIPSGKLPVARVLLQATTDAITNAVIVDERALTDLTPAPKNTVICRATLNGVDQTGVPTGTLTKVNLNATDFNIGGGFDTTNKWFKPNVAGYYAIRGQIGTLANSGSNIASVLLKNGAQISWNCACPGSSIYQYTGGNDIVYLNGSTDYVELFGAHNNGSNGYFQGTGYATFLTAQLIN